MPKQITKYQCNYCKKSWTQRFRAVKHEVSCYHNPSNRSCSSCCWKDKDEDTGSRWCDYLDKEIYVQGSPIIDCEVWLPKDKKEAKT